MEREGLGPRGAEKIVHAFAGADGKNPRSAVVRDAKGNLSGTTPLVGAYDLGAVYTISSAGVETVLYSFKGKSKGNLPLGGLVMDANGTFYGTTCQGRCVR